MSQSIAKPFKPEQSVGGAAEWEAILNKMIGRTYTITLARVTEVLAGGSGPVGFVNAVDLVQQQAFGGDGIPNVPMEKLPYFRLQGGSNAVIIDPQVGDIGIVAFARRDISEVKRSKSEGPPPSKRTHSASDGIWLGGVLNGSPTQYVQFHEDHIELKPLTRVLVTGDLECTGNVSDKTGTMQTMRDQYNSHVHGGSPNTSVPMT